MGKHLNRQQLIRAAQRLPSVPDSHLESCADCREAVDLLRAFKVHGRLSLPDAPSPWVDRAASLAGSAGFLGRVKTLIARLTFDSWAVPEVVGVRGQGALGDRRIRFESEGIILDFRAERQTDRWAFVAHVTGEVASFTGVVLQVGKKSLNADSSGLFQWTSRRPPTTVTIRAGDVCIVTPELSWKRP
jgi:hypothetical protein